MPRIVILHPGDSINDACEYAGKGGFVLLQETIKLPDSKFSLDGQGAVIMGHQNGRFEFEEYTVTVVRKKAKSK